MARAWDTIRAKHKALAGKSRLYRWGASIVRIGVLAYVLFTLFLYGCQSKMIYFPKSEIETTPKASGLDYEDVTLEPAPGATIHGWWVPCDHARGTVIFFHGNAGNISHRIDSIRDFHRIGMNVFIIDYRGYGKSSGRPGEKRTYEDAMAAWKYVTEERAVAAADTVIFGRSLGGAVAAWLASETQPRALILESAFTSVVDMGKHYYPILPVKLVTRIRYPTIDYLARVKCPVLIAHSAEDDIVPYKFGKRLYEAAGEPKAFLEMRGGHNDGWITTGGAYLRGLDEFITRHVAPRRPREPG